MKTEYAEILMRGGIGVLPTDTLYGIVGSAFNKGTVERIYKLRKRNPKKPFIILIGDMGDATWRKFGIKLSTTDYKLLTRLWPGKVSVVLPCASKKFAYLHRGTKTLAFRYPRPTWLQNLLKKTGPLVAPSANSEGEPPAKTITEAKEYFNDKVDFYVNRGRLDGKPSTLVALTDGKLKVLRQGAVRIAHKK